MPSSRIIAPRGEIGLPHLPVELCFVTKRNYHPACSRCKSRGRDSPPAARAITLIRRLMSDQFVSLHGSGTLY